MTTGHMHNLLKRQLKKYGGDNGHVLESCKKLLDAVSAAYREFDEDRMMIERSLEQNSQELLQTNSELKNARATLEKRVEERTAELVRANQLLQEEINERVRAQATIQSQFQKLAALRDIDTAITSSFDVNSIIRVILKEVIEQLYADAAAILLLNQNTLMLEYIDSQGFKPGAFKNVSLRLGESHAGRAALEKTVVSIPNFSTNKKSHPDASLPDHIGFMEYLAVPLISKGQVKGVLEIFKKSPINLDQEWMDFMESIASQTAIALDYAEMITSLERSNIELTLAYDTTLEGWSRALDYRDKETEGHSRRVTEMTLTIAKEMGMSDDDIVHARRGALLHDIGKLGVPDSILLKPGPLTAVEMEIMKKHTTIAHEILWPIVFLRKAIDIPHCHHEKWDGSGYPCGLKGEDIPLSARIFAVVDVYDALRSDRPYRPAWTKGKALDYINSETGKHFDREIVESFMGMEF
jgi:putative nucleotidyltransferase with HDIG domain